MLAKSSQVRRSCLAGTVGALVLWTCAGAFADDWPQWLGPQRDAHWRESGILNEFPADGAKVLWRTPVAGGYAGPAVANGRVYVTDYVRQEGDAANEPGRRNELQGTERVLCLSAETGDVLWKYEYDRPYRISYPAGPRATPTVDQDRVYTLGAEGNLLCLSATSGEVIWGKELQKEYNCESPIWGFSSHPLVDGDRLICLVGGEGSVAVAFNKLTGEEIWRALSASETGYAPPSIIEAAGVRQLLIWDADQLHALNPETGQVYWSQPLKPDYGMSIMQPQKSGDLLFASGIGNVGALFRLNQQQPGIEKVWTGKPNTALYAANSTPQIEDGVIYGCDCRSGALMAVDLESGERLWQSFDATTGTRRAGHGTAFLVKQANRYFLFSETGDIVIADLSRNGYRELSRAHVLEPTGEAFGRSVLWSHPALAGRCAFWRNDRELICVSLSE